uniref:Putative tick transposon n=1 Tax=Ixodes ricinus TaxID=34613 RepID=A0A147BTT5_IXORI
MTVANHFVFIAQVLLLLPPHWACDAVKSCPAAIHRAECIVTADNEEAATGTDRNFLRWTFNENLEFSRFTSPPTSATSAPALPSIKDHPRSSLPCGHGGIAKMTVANHFVFIAQVGKRYPFCYRSNNLCLFLLPCPRTCFALLCGMRARFADLLMLCGDIETNPGPDTAAVMEMLTNISVDIKEIKLSQAVTTSRLEKIESRLEGLEGLRSVVNKNCDKTNRLEATITSLSNKIYDLENRSRRNNLIIFGLSELPNEESSTLEDKVTKEILGGKLNVNINGIDRIHRLGKPAHGKTRPVIFRLVNFKD